MNLLSVEDVNVKKEPPHDILSHFFYALNCTLSAGKPKKHRHAMRASYFLGSVRREEMELRALYGGRFCSLFYHFKFSFDLKGNVILRQKMTSFVA